LQVSVAVMLIIISLALAAGLIWQTPTSEEEQPLRLPKQNAEFLQVANAIFKGALRA
jgi:hypothetical protein